MLVHGYMRPNVLLAALTPREHPEELANALLNSCAEEMDFYSCLAGSKVRLLDYFCFNVPCTVAALPSVYEV